MFISPLTLSARASARVCRSISAMIVVGQAVGRDRAGAVARMDPGFLDMLEDAGDRDLLAVADRVDVDLDRVAQIAVDQHRRADPTPRPRWRYNGRAARARRPPPSPARRARRTGAAAPDSRCARRRSAPRRGCGRCRWRAAAGPSLLDQFGEALAVLGQIDAVGRGAEDRHARRLQLGGELERRLPAKLDDHARPVRPSRPRAGRSRARPRRSAARNRAGRWCPGRSTPSPDCN